MARFLDRNSLLRDRQRMEADEGMWCVMERWRQSEREATSLSPIASLLNFVYLAWTKNPLDRALPPPATTSMNDIPAFTSGTVASIVVSLTKV